MVETDQPKKSEGRKPFATEKPVPTGDSTEKPAAAGEMIEAAGDAQPWVVTVNNRDGTVLKLEKLDPKTGQKAELSKDEQAAVSAYFAFYASYWKGAADYAATLSPGDLSRLQTYYQQLADSCKALAKTS